MYPYLHGRCSSHIQPHYYTLASYPCFSRLQEDQLECQEPHLEDHLVCLVYPLALQACLACQGSHQPVLLLACSVLLATLAYLACPPPLYSNSWHREDMISRMRSLA